MRLQGKIGTAIVTWEVQGNNENDIVESSGILVFGHNQTIGNIEIKIREDTVPELDETYQVQLKSVQPVS